MTRVMYDSVDVDQIPGDASAVLGYVGPKSTSNIYVTFPELVRQFRKANKVSIADQADLDAEFLDIERYDATPEQFPAWWRRMNIQKRYRPGFYASRDNVPAVIAAAAAGGIARHEYRIISAHYGVGAHICSPVSCGASFTADATQWTDKALGRNLDESLLSDTFFPTAKPKPKPNPKPRPKVTAATLAAALTVAIQTAVNAAGAHITPVEASAIATVAAGVAGYWYPEKRA